MSGGWLCRVGLVVVALCLASADARAQPGKTSTSTSTPTNTSTRTSTSTSTSTSTRTPTSTSTSTSTSTPTPTSTPTLTPVNAANAAARLSQAADALRRGEHRKAGMLAATVARSVAAVGKQDRAEAWRIYGLSLYFDKQLEQAERAFVEYLKLEPNAHLEPSLVVPEAIIFFESVRTRNAATLHQYRPKPKTKRRRILNWLAPAGQFQNGHRLKGTIIGVGGVLLLATNITTFFVLRDLCDEITGVCTNSQGESVRSKANNLRRVNLSTALAFAALYAYAVIDGLVYFKRSQAKKSLSVGVVPGPDGTYLSIAGRF